MLEHLNIDLHKQTISFELILTDSDPNLLLTSLKFVLCLSRGSMMVNVPSEISRDRLCPDPIVVCNLIRI